MSLRARLEEKPKIKSVYITNLKHMTSCGKKLEDYYEDTSASAQAALEDLKKLKPVQEEDYKSLVELVDDVEGIYNQLGELNHLNTLSMRDVDALSDLLPTHLKIDWRRKYSNLSPAEKLQPFTPFMMFLEKERSMVSQLAEDQPARRQGSHHIDGGIRLDRREYFRPINEKG